VLSHLRSYNKPPFKKKPTEKTPAEANQKRSTSLYMLKRSVAKEHHA